MITSISCVQDTLEKYYTTKSHRNAVTLSWDHVMAQVNILATPQVAQKCKST